MAPPPSAANLPNSLTLSRIVLCPLLFGLALLQHPTAFLVIFAIALLTDLFDGLLARLLHQQTDLGALLDSIADAALWIVVIPSVCMLWPDICRREAAWILGAIVAFIVPGILGLLRYHQVSGYHTWSAKLSMAAAGLSLFLLIAGISPWPFRASILLLVWASIEESLMTLWLPEPRHDIPSIWHARADRQQKRRHPEVPPGS